MTALPDDRITGGRRLITLDRRESVDLLRTVRFGRLVFTLRALPEVIPVNFELFEGAVVIRVADTSRVLDGAVDAVVAFEADEIDSGTGTGWSVTVVGHTAEILDPCERARVLALPLVPWAGGTRDRLVRIPLDRVTGRRLLLPAAGTDAAPGEGHVPLR